MNPILKQMIFLILRFLIICFHIYYNPLGWLTTQLLLLTIYFQITPEHNTLSGSVLSRISDHFPQFLVMTKVNIDYKRCSFAKRDFWNLNEQKFISDFSNINHIARCCSHYDDFRYRHKCLVDRLLSQGYIALRLEKSFKKFYGRYQDLIEKYQRSVNVMVNDSFPG